MQWFRLYNDMPSDAKIEELAFEDRWHFVNVLCMKSRGVLDDNYASEDMRERKISRELGLRDEAFSFAKQRLIDIGLIDDQWQPTKWDDLQYQSDSSATRQRNYRERKKKHNALRNGDVTVTAQESESESESETDTYTDSHCTVTEKEKIPKSYSQIALAEGIHPSKVQQVYQGYLDKASRHSVKGFMGWCKRETDGKQPPEPPARDWQAEQTTAMAQSLANAKRVGIG